MAGNVLSNIVGSANVLDAVEVLESYAKDLSFVPKVRPGYIVKPEDSKQVKKIVEWANETLTPIIPISSGAPHFRGDSVPSVGGAVIVDLSGMKRIPRIDPRNRVAMIEPGVTFSELQEALKREGMCAYMPLSPRKTKSVIGSMLEREPITMPAHHWDATDPMLCAEMIFGTGDILRGGEAAGPDTIEEQWEIGKAHMTPMGLSQFNEHRLLSGAQGTIGIVVWSTLKCRLLSELNQTYLIPSRKLEPLIDLTYRLLRIRLADHCFILNGLNMACLLGQKVQEIKKISAKLPPWVLVISFEGCGELPEEKVQYQAADFMDISKASGLYPKTTIPGADAMAVSDLFTRTSEEPYWKLRYKGGCHDIFFLTTLDRTPGFESALATLAMSQQYSADDIGIYIQPVVQGTSCHCEFNLFADPSDKEEAGKVKWIVEQGSRSLAKNGAFFSRPYGMWRDFAYGSNAETVDMQRKVKKIFDPNNILNPAKLCL